jgi:hypothetical protein
MLQFIKSSVQTMVILLLVLLFNNQLKAQDTEEKKFGISFNGFVKMDYMADSRQTVTAREGHFLLFPQPELLDANDDDVNATPNFNALAIQTRITGKIKGPDFFSMKTKGLIEGAFFGHSNSDVNGFRLRHAFFTLSNEKIELLMGQYWHPMFVTACYPKVFSFNTGVPFQPFSRNPQLRLSTKGDFRIIASILTQRDFASRGPSGTSSVYLRNAILPNLNLQTQFTSGMITAGAGIDYKVLKPRIVAFEEKANETVQGITGQVFIKFSSTKFEIRAEGVYGQNLADHLMLGGYGETTYNIGLGEIEYLPFSVFSTWVDISGKFAKGEWGIFGGYTDNLGLSEPLEGGTYTLGGNIDNIWRVSPRIAWVSGKTKIGLEFETTAATYGILEVGDKEVNSEGVDPVYNMRGLLFGMYSF